jgi:hypothetical protein
MAFFSKTNFVIHFLHNLALFWANNANFFAKFFGENIFYIITFVPVWPNFRPLGDSLLSAVFWNFMKWPKIIWLLFSTAKVKYYFWG